MPTSKRTRRGRLIVFEGPDGSGKTTISKRLVKEIECRGHRCRWLAFPGHEPDTLGATVYAWHHDDRFARVPVISRQLLHVAAHIDAIENVIRPALRHGQWVVLDRYWWSTWAYGIAGGARAKELDLALRIERARWLRIQPEILFLFERQQPESSAPSEVLLRLYRVLANRERRSHPFELVRNNGTVQEALSHVVARIFHSSNCPQ